MIRIAPSLVSAPFANLGEALALLEEGGADLLHFDLEDGCFVPVMNLGTRIIQELRPLTSLPFDVHLMVQNPEWLLPELAKMGVQRLSVHFEACPYPRRTLGLIAEHGMQAGLAFNPKTELPDLAFCRPFLSFILLLTTEPEAGDCSYLLSVLSKLRRGKQLAELRGVEWAVDGGVTPENAREVVQAGADILISGRGVFKDGEIGRNIARMKLAGQVAA
jgi:ribulose-phosphate 3-epimerase